MPAQNRRHIIIVFKKLNGLKPISHLTELRVTRIFGTSTDTPNGVYDTQSTRIAQVSFHVFKGKSHALLHLHDLFLDVILLAACDEKHIGRDQRHRPKEPCHDQFWHGESALPSAI